MPKAEDLNTREAAFVDEYLVDGIGAQAAIRAGYSEKAARQIASRLLTKANVKAAIRKALAEQEKRTLITADAVLKRIDRVARKAEAAGDFNAANAANKLLGQHYKLFTEKHEHGGIGGGPVQFQLAKAEENH
jgi:phage terminase small subunit